MVIVARDGVGCGKAWGSVLAATGDERPIAATILVKAVIVYVCTQSLMNVFSIAWAAATTRPMPLALTDRLAFLLSPGPALAYAMLIAKHWDRLGARSPQKLYVWSWVGLLGIQLTPLFVHGFRIVYLFWTFVLATTAAACAICADVFLREAVTPDDAGSECLRLEYDHARFLFDKLIVAWVALGTVTGVAMTILWTSPETAFPGDYAGRMYVAIYMLMGFMGTTLLAVLFVGIPLVTDRPMNTTSSSAKEHQVA